MFKKTYLTNGIPVIMEQMKGVSSVSLGIWVNVGSRYEAPDRNGVSHFLEHMFFKGTQKLSAKDIAVAADSLGCDLNAFTSRENTAFYVRILNENFEKGMDLLSDIFLNSTFQEEEIEKEKGIIGEEIKMAEDTPDDYIHDLFTQTIWGSNGIGQPILGRVETINLFKREDISDHINKYYGVENTIIACAGDFDSVKLIDTLNKNFSSMRVGTKPKHETAPAFENKTEIFTKDLSEVHICIGTEGVSQTSKHRYELYLLNTIFGSSVSSRLFQEVREKRGLVYSIYSYLASYLDTGVWAVYAGASRQNTVEVINIVLKELKDLFETITENELQRAKDQLKGNLILGLESTGSRMQNIARQELYYGKYYSIQEIIKNINKIKLKQVKELSKRLTENSKFSLTVLGPINENELKGVLCC